MWTATTDILPFANNWHQGARTSRQPAAARTRKLFNSAGLLVAASLPLAHDAVTGIVTAVNVIASVLLMVLQKADALWIVFGAAVVNLVAAAMHIRSAFP
jgi:hypothetical protein